MPPPLLSFLAVPLLCLPIHLLSLPSLRRPVTSLASRARPKRTKRPSSTMPNSLRVAVIGCAHGELDALYAALQEVQSRPSEPAIDLVLCAGDFQAVRNAADLSCMAVPDKFKHMRDFHRYYSGASLAPIPTIFIGGNHEASNHLQELPYGGLVAPNIFYLGPAGVVTFRGLRIAGLSGVYTPHNFRKPPLEAPPYPGNTLKSVYHTREAPVAALSRLVKPLDVVLSHDWPAGIAAFGDIDDLLRRKPFLKSEVADGSFGSPASATLLSSLRPRYWFSAHVHVKFAAVVPHADGTTTRFLALDKALPRRDFVQILDIEPSGDSGGDGFSMDDEWMAILASPGDRNMVSEEECKAAMAAVKAAGLDSVPAVPDVFHRTAQVYDPRARATDRPHGVTVQKRCLDLAKALGVELKESIVAQARHPVPVGIAQVAPEVAQVAPEVAARAEVVAAPTGAVMSEEAAVGVPSASGASTEALVDSESVPATAAGAEAPAIATGAAVVESSDRASPLAKRLKKEEGAKGESATL